MSKAYKSTWYALVVVVDNCESARTYTLGVRTHILDVAICRHHVIIVVIIIIVED